MLFEIFGAAVVNFRIKVVMKRISTNQNLGFSCHKPIVLMHSLHTRAVGAIRLTRSAT